MFAPHDTAESLLTEYRVALSWAIQQAADEIWWSIRTHDGIPDWHMHNRYE